MDGIQQDIEAVAQIPIINSLLDVVCQTTGMGFAAIARVTEDRWVTCGVRDDIAFGLKPGDELQVRTTICNEIRHSQKAVVIDHVKEDPAFCDHHTPAMYGFQSYISVPIIRKDGSFFGTLCAIDPNPNKLNTPKIIGMFNLFSDLISFHLNALDEMRLQKTFSDELEKQVMERTVDLEDKVIELARTNKELQSFAYISSHDLQEPLRKIQSFAARIMELEQKNLTDKTKDYFLRMQSAANRMQSLIEDLLAYSRTNTSERKFEVVNLDKVLDEVKSDLAEELEHVNGVIEKGEMCDVKIIPFQFRQLLHNLVTNSLKFYHPGTTPMMTIYCEVGKGSTFPHEKLVPDLKYCHISFQDNGIGFEQEYSDKIFELFQRLHGKLDYQGTGIGLAIVKKIVENHHGFISASSEPGKGARFDIYIPGE